MRQTAFLLTLLLVLCTKSFAANPDVLWQDYQKSSGYISNKPTKIVEAEKPNITIEGEDGVTKVPEVQQSAAEKAEAGGEPQGARQAVISNKPVAMGKPKPKLNLVGRPPLPRQFMRTPQTSDFVTVTSSAGYSVSIPYAFGKDPLADLPKAEGAMLVRSASDNLMCAVTVLDVADIVSYNAVQELPVYESKKVYWQWRHGDELIWNCTLSAHNDYHGDKVLLEAQVQQNGKIYQMLFVMPEARFMDLLPQAVYALDSFKLN